MIPGFQKAYALICGASIMLGGILVYQGEWFEGIMCTLMGSFPVILFAVISWLDRKRQK